jgi:DNA-binding transcriptional MerR regulator
MISGKMEPVQEKDKNKFINLKKASQILGVNIETLLEWNDINILKPVITQAGKVGYTEKQLNKFILLRENTKQTDLSYKALQKQKDKTSNSIRKPISESGAHENSVEDNLSTLDIQLVSKQKIKKDSKTNFSTFKLAAISFFSFLFVIAISLITSASKSNIGSMTNKADGLEKVQVSDKTNDNIPLSKASLNSLNMPSEVNSSNKENDNRLELAGHNLVFLNPGYKERIFSINENNQNDLSDIVNEEALSNITESSKIGNLPFNTGTFSSYAARSNLETNSENILENEDNLTSSDLPNNLLSANFASLVKTQQRNNKTLNWLILIFLFPVGLVFLKYHFSNLPALSSPSGTSTQFANANVVINPLTEKVFEVDQKTDGTVVIYHKDNEYKVSKPELNSETDQFIQRLLGFIKEGEKETKYDIVKDERLNLKTPLSKVVTRLGFVGLKRDLFFPRTSKNKVVFRKYITINDLGIMNIKEDEAVHKISSSN